MQDACERPESFADCFLAEMWQGHREVAPGSMEGRRGQAESQARGAAWRGQTSLLLEDGSGWGWEVGEGEAWPRDSHSAAAVQGMAEGDGARGGGQRETSSGSLLLFVQKSAV